MIYPYKMRQIRELNKVNKWTYDYRWIIDIYLLCKNK